MAIETKTDLHDDACAVNTKSEGDRKAEAVRRFADKLNASSPGVTPKWQRAIETYKRVKAQQSTR
jgi:hypothetical protein